MGQFKMKAGRKVFRLISNQWGFDLFVTGRSTFLLSERSLSFNFVMIIVRPVKRDWAVLSKDTPVDISI